MKDVRRPSSPAETSITISVSELKLLAVIFVLLLARMAVAGHVGLSADEAYYWTWTRPLQLSYYDHPPAVSWWIKGGLFMFGESAFAVRSLTTLTNLLVILLVWDSTRRSFASRPAAALAALWLAVSPLFVVAGIIVTPDSPLLLFWALALWAAVRLIHSGQSGWLLLLGLALGLGADSKYTMALLLPGLLITVLLVPALRRWLIRPAFAGAIVLGLLALLPVLIWNIRNNFASFTKQADHAFATEIANPLANAGQWLGSQVGLISPLLFIAVLVAGGLGLWRGWRDRRADWLLFGLTSLPLLLFFARQSMVGVVQAHWAGPAYLSGIILAAGFAAPWSQQARWRLRLCQATTGLAALISLLILTHALWVWLPIPVKVDPLKRLGGWTELAGAIEQERDAHPGAALMTQKHEPTGALTFYLDDHPPVFLSGGGIRPAAYSAADVAALRGRDVIFMIRSKENSEGAESYYGKFFRSFKKLRQVDMHWHGQIWEQYQLYLGTRYQGGLLVQGDGRPGTLDGAAP